MRLDTNGGRSKNYEPNSFDGPVQTNQPHYHGLRVEGLSGTYECDRRKTDDFEQAGTLYRLIDASAKQRLVDNIAGSLAHVDHREIVDRSISYFSSADTEYGDRIERAVALLRS
jgi:catalase